jgi:hypothetical protein
MHANPGVIKLLQERLVSVATAVESSVDDELHRLDNLTEDDLETVRQKRLDQMKRMAAKRQEWLARGHGTYREVNGEKARGRPAKRCTSLARRVPDAERARGGRRSSSRR